MGGKEPAEASRCKRKMPWSSYQRSSFLEVLELIKQESKIMRTLFWENSFSKITIYLTHIKVLNESTKQ